LRRTLPETTELTTNQRILETSPSDSVRVWAKRRLFELAADLDSLELGSRYLAKYPDAEAAATVRRQVETLAQRRVLQGRLHESLRRYQEALDQYNEVILLAPGSAAAATARTGIERVQKLAGS
jgi:tetratricopeptide (TPR) repeat protein